MDWKRIERDLNLHTMSLTHSELNPLNYSQSTANRSFSSPPSPHIVYSKSPLDRFADTRSKLPSPVSSGQILGSSTLEYDNFSQLSPLDKRYRQSTVSNDYELLSKDFASLKQVNSQLIKRMDQMESVINDLKYRYDDIAKDRDDLLSKLHTIESDRVEVARSVMALKKDRHGAGLELKAMAQRVGGLEDRRVADEDLFVSREALTQLVDSFTQQFKLVRFLREHLYSLHECFRE